MESTFMRELSDYAFSPLREGDFPIYRGSGDSLPPGTHRAGVSCKPHFRGASVYDRRNSLMIGGPQALPPAAGSSGLRCRRRRLAEQVGLDH